MLGFLIQAAVEHYAEVTPRKAALSLQGRELSYAELNRGSNRLAHALRSNGIVVGDRVGIFLHKSLEMGMAIYGTLKAGGVFVPLDPFMPADRLQFILDDCDIEHIVTSDALADTLCEINADRVLHVYGANIAVPFPRKTWREIDGYPDTSPNAVLIDQDLGYIMYTSGSTGVPKGMMHTHLGSITYARWGVNHVKLTENDRVASHAPLHFDLSVFDFFSTALAGATVVLVPEVVARFPASWTNLIESERVSVVFTVPYTLMTMYSQGAMDKRDLGSLRWILFGGEPYPPQQLRELMLALDHVAFTNVYGPAEAPSCTCFDVPLPELHSDTPIPIGTVSANSTDIIIDANELDCDIGVPGELCIRSTSLTRGYWNRPDLNEAAFLYRESEGPFPHVYFRTGDRVVRQEDGLLRFIGRIGRMVKTRGHRVELDEIEAVLSSCDAVSEVAAYAVPDEHASHTVLAAVSINAGSETSESELLLFAKRKLPNYAVPRRVFLLDALPHTSSGKLDRQSLIEDALLHKEANQ